MIQVLRALAPAPLFAFTAGFVDTTGFIALFGLFTAHVTGNFVLIGATLADYNPGLISKFLALPVFMLTVAAARVYVLRREARAADASGGLLMAQLLFLCLFMAAGLAASPFGSADAPVTILVGQCGVVAMAIQNAASRTAFAHLSPTTVMTGNVTLIVIDTVDLIGPRGDRRAAKARLKKMLPPVITFALGAMAGALGYIAFGFWCLLAPIAGVLAIYALRGSRNPSS